MLLEVAGLLVLALDLGGSFGFFVLSRDIMKHKKVAQFADNMPIGPYAEASSPKDVVGSLCMHGLEVSYHTVWLVALGAGCDT